VKWHSAGFFVSGTSEMAVEVWGKS
jgi:hypothetical protein